MIVQVEKIYEKVEYGAGGRQGTRWSVRRCGLCLSVPDSV